MATGAFGKVAVKMDRVARSLGGEALQTLSETAALTVKKEALSQLVRTVGGDRALSGYGRGAKRGKVKGDVGFDYEGDGISVVKYRAPGFWILLEEGSYKAGGQWKTPRRKGRRRGRGEVATYRRQAVRPRRTMTKAQEAAAPKMHEAVADKLADIVADLMAD